MRAHGLKGDVTLALDAEAPADFEDIKTIFIEVRQRLVPFFIESISLKGTKAFVKLEEVNSREDAENLSKSPVFLPKASRPQSARGEFYDDEVIGFEMTDTSHGTLGKITEILQAGPNKLLSVSYRGKDVLVPLNSPFIKEVNKQEKIMTVTLPEGLLDI